MSPSHKINSNEANSSEFLDAPPPPQLLLSADDVAALESEAGLSGEAAMQQKEQDALLQKIAKLERELFVCRHNMGLLAVEKKERSSKYEVMGETLAGLQEELEREKAEHLNSLSQFKKREENLMKALDTETKSVSILKKALRESGAEFERVKQSSEAKSVKTDALLSELEEKSMDLDNKLHVADAKLEEVNRKSLELDRKLQEVETRDSLLQRERISFIAECEAHEATFIMQKNDLQEWERKLQEGEERLCEHQRITIEREVKVNEAEKALKLKEQELKEAEKEIGLSTSVLKRKEDDIHHGLANLTAQEHKAETLRIDLEMKGKELLVLTEKLTAREREFEVEMDGKRKSLNDEERSRLDALQYREEEITDRAEKLSKFELSLENKSERIKEKEKDLEAKLRTLNEKENLLKSDEKRLDLEKKQIFVDKNYLLIFKGEIEKTRTDISQRERKIQEEIEKLKIAEEERAEYIYLQAEFKKEIETRDSLLRREQSFIAELEAHEATFSKQKYDLQEWERSLQEREARFSEGRVEVHKFLSGERAALNAKMQEFEVEMDGKRKSLNDEESRRLDALQYKEGEITHRAEKLGKLELSLDNKYERIKQKERDLEAKLRNLKEEWILLKSDEKRLDLEKKKMLVDKDSFQTFKDEIEKTRTDISQRESKIREEIMKLKISEEERAENIRLQLELKEEIETRDTLFRRERISFIAEREAQEATFSVKENDLKEWERKLQEGEERLCEGRRITTEREVKVNETEMALKLREQHLEKAQKEIELSTSVLKRKEDDLNHRLANLTAQEHKAEILRSDLEMKDKELLALTEKLADRERIQMLLDEQCSFLDAKMQEFKVEMDGKWKSLNDEKRSRLDALQCKEDEITHKAEKLGKLELSLENKFERIKEKEKYLEAKLRTLKEKENLLKSDEKRLDLEKKQMLVDMDSLQTIKDEIEKTMSEISQRESKIKEETENLKMSKEERADYIRLQSELKEEIKKFEKSQLSEADRLKNDRLAIEDYVKRESETLEIEKETFATIMMQEQSLVSEKAQLEHRQMLHGFPLCRKDLEVDLQKKQEDLEAHMNERERAFVGEREREYNNINYLKKAAQKDMEESSPKRRRIEKELEENQLEKNKDINELQVPDKKVRVEGELFINEREPFLLFASSQDITSEKDDPTRPVDVMARTSLENEDISTEGDVKLKTSETHDKSAEPALTENIECNEEVNSMIPECSIENERKSTLHEDGDNEFESRSEAEDLLMNQRVKKCR